MVLTFQGWRFQRWRQASLWIIRGINRRRSESNVRGAYRIIGGNSTSRFCTIESHGMIQKQGNWVPYELKSGDVKKRFFTCEQLIQRQQRKDFLQRIVRWEVDILRQPQEEKILR